MAAQKTWTRIRPVFKAEFAAFSDDKHIIDGLAKLTHRPNENPRMFFSRLEELVFVLKENYASYRVKPERPAPIQPQGTYTEDALTKYANDSVDAFANFLFTQMFKAAAPENVRQLLSHKDQSRLTVEEAYKVFFNPGNKATTGATTALADRTTEATTTIARTSTKTTVSPRTTSPKTVNTVFIAK
jgi:hypothetical protein